LKGAVLLWLVTLVSCVPGDDAEVLYAFRIDVQNPDQQHLLELQDRQLTDSLTPYLSHPDPSLRYRAAMAFASISDSTVIHALGTLLSDKQPEVRNAAAFALGQIRSSQAEDVLVHGFDAVDSSQTYIRANASILEAVGKTGNENSLRFLSTIESYDIRDSILILGQARGIYRFALRGITLQEGTDVMVDLMASTQLPSSIRVIAANYLLRARNIDTKAHLSTLIPVFRQDKDPRIRMCVATALGKSRDNQALSVLKRQFGKEKDYRVRANIIRALNYYPYNSGKNYAFNALTDDNLHVARTAAQYLVDKADGTDAKRLRAVARGQLPWEVKSLLYLATEKHMSRNYAITKGNMHGEIIDWFQRSQNPYEKAALIRALAGDATNYQSVYDLGFSAGHPAIRTAAVEAISQIAVGQDLVTAYGKQAAIVRRKLAGYLMEAINSSDVAMIAVASGALSDNALKGFALNQLDKLRLSLDKLELPKAIETYNALAQCIAEIKGDEFRPKSLEYNNPVDWSLVSSLRDTVLAELITSSGTILLDLYTYIAPGTVANFVQLSRDRFYNGKNFHRVVPNFVIQGGCPRGDGYGSLDYTIRSEFLPLYYDDEGYLGMASAGMHTEGTQWFITHSPTPHLDGKYTIFGRVRSGMNVVHTIQVGDEIREINIVN
jgi:cyclophilin family peptidyl-prolyl cis-trans isomerase